MNSEDLMMGVTSDNHFFPVMHICLTSATISGTVASMSISIHGFSSIGFSKSLSWDWSRAGCMKCSVLLFNLFSSNSWLPCRWINKMPSFTTTSGNSALVDLTSRKFGTFSRLSSFSVTNWLFEFSTTPVLRIVRYDDFKAEHAIMPFRCSVSQLQHKYN